MRPTRRRVNACVRIPRRNLLLPDKDRTRVRGEVPSGDQRLLKGQMTQVLKLKPDVEIADLSIVDMEIGQRLGLAGVAVGRHE